MLNWQKYIMQRSNAIVLNDNQVKIVGLADCCVIITKQSNGYLVEIHDSMTHAVVDSYTEQSIMKLIGCTRPELELV